MANLNEMPGANAMEEFDIGHAGERRLAGYEQANDELRNDIIKGHEENDRLVGEL